MSFWELIIAYPNGGQWAPFSYVFHPWLNPAVTPLAIGYMWFQGEAVCRLQLNKTPFCG